MRELVPLFNKVRSILSRVDLNNGEVKRRADKWAQKIKYKIKRKVGGRKLDNLKYKRIIYKSDILEPLIEWYRLYLTHKEGLFHCYYIKGLP